MSDETDNFAKLFKRDGYQVLVRIGDDSSVIITFHDEEKNLLISPSVNFYPKDDTDEAMDAAWDQCDKFFKSIDEDKAFAFRDRTLAEVSKVLKGH
jgi:prefoldin subunit 5